MKRNFFRYICIALLAVLLFVLGGQRASAQDDFVQVKMYGYVQGLGSDKKSFLPTQWTYFRSEVKAKAAKALIDAAIDRCNTGRFDEKEEVEKVSKNNNIVWNSSKNSGEIVVNGLVGGCVLIYGNSATATQKIASANAIYEVKLNGRYELTGVITTAKKGKLAIDEGDTDQDEFGDTLTFNINFTINEGVTDKSRLIIQPYVIDCQTEDTLSYLKPIVYESADYHKMQDRRMGFDYFANDSVARGYAGEKVLEKDQPFHVDALAVYRKPDRMRSYKGAYKWYLEDYHRVLLSRAHPGSCLSRNRFRLIDYSSASAALPLTEEFHQAADPTPQKFEQNIDLRFRKASDELLTDSLNEINLNTLIDELNKYGDMLQSVTIQGGASAEGTLEVNTKWANKRAEKALALLRGRLPSDVPRKRLEPRISTWNDVLEAVVQQGDSAVAGTVRAIVTGHKPNEINNLLRAQPFYETVIEPILVSQRMMKCQYYVSRNKVLEPKEAVEVYYRDKKEMLKGKKYMSEGDYYNLFATIQDKAELDTVTMITYKFISSQPGYTKMKLAPYVANRWALYNLQKGTPNLEILRPFLDLDLNQVNAVRSDYYNTSVKWTLNREEHLLNQAVTYFQLQYPDTARAIVKRMPQTEKVNRLLLMIDFVKNYRKCLAGKLSDEQDQRIEFAKRTVIDTSVENRAVVAAEFGKDTGMSRDSIEAYIDKMPDDNPKKWYLKGIVWADEEVAGKEKSSGADDFSYNNKTAGGQGEDKKVVIPYYLAYLQHSFDLDMEYKRMYFRDGHISEELRKRFPYQKKHFDDYRKKFEELKAEADKNKAFDTLDNTPLPDNTVPYAVENTNTENSEQPSVDANE